MGNSNGLLVFQQHLNVHVQMAERDAFLVEDLFQLLISYDVLSIILILEVI
jgi:hypothetical protein